MFREKFSQIDDNFAYLDNAATAYKPTEVIDAIEKFYRLENASPKRGLYDASVRVTELLESARKKVADFIGADADEIIFTSGATAGLNMLALSLGASLKGGDSIAVSKFEHHSNLLPWRKQGSVKYFENAGGISDKAKIIAFSPYSNVLGAANQNYIESIFARAKEIGALTVLDCTQAVAHQKLNFHELGADFLVFSGHKLYGPMGIGVICGKRDRLKELRPTFWGGEMVDDVSITGEILAEIPDRFEAGTVNVAGAVGLAAAVDFLQANGFDELLTYEKQLASKLHQSLQNIPHLYLVEHANFTPATICSFSIDDVHPHDIAQILSENNIAVRAGYHCAQLAIGEPTVRASLSFYNTETECRHLTECLGKMRSIMHVR